MRNTKILMLSLLIFVFVVLIIAVLFFDKLSKPTPLGEFPVPTKTELRDTTFNRFIPGQTTYEDVIKSMGDPLTSKTVDTKIYITYATKFSSLPNVFVFNNNILLYSIENFFGDYKKSLSYYTDRYGQPELLLFDINDETVEWMIFPKYGIALSVFSFDKAIVKILYFSPQTKEAFEKNFLEELSLTKETPEEIENSIQQTNEIFDPGLESITGFSPTPTL